MMNAGLSALMPGQAAPNMAGVLPQPSQAAPNAVPSKVDALARLPFEQLQAMYRNPPKGVPAYAIIAARDKQMKAEQMREAQQGLMAQQQVAGQQGTVADNLMAVRAARGGEMRVQGFQAGGLSRQERDLQRLMGNEVPDPEAGSFWREGLPGVGRDLLDVVGSVLRGREALREGVGRALTYSSDVEKKKEKEADRRAAQERAARVSQRRGQTEPLGEVLEQQIPSPATNRGLGAPRTPSPAQTTSPAATQQRQQTQAPAFDIDALTSAIEQTGVIPPEILEERKALAAARKAQLERQQAAAERYKAGLEESPEDRRMRAFAAIAEGLSSSPRLSRGLSAALSGLTKSEAESRRAKREGMKEVMTLEDAAANLQIAMQEQALADRTGDNKLKTAAAVAVAQAQQAYQKSLLDQAVTQQRADAETLNAQARMADVKQGGSNAGTTAVLAQRRLILENEIKRLEEAANPLSPTTEAVKAAARTRADALRRELLALGGVESGGATAPTAASDIPPPGAVQRVK